jgi:hypothetical protein
MISLKNYNKLVSEEFNEYHKQAISDSEGDGEFEDHYSGKKPEAYEYEDEYYGRNVIWIGNTGKTLKIPSEYVTSREDNIFDYDKAKVLANYIRDHDDRVVFRTSDADVRHIDLDDVKTSQHNPDYMGISRSFTTGDEELDQFLANGDDAIGDIMIYSGEYLNDDYTLDLPRLQEELYEDDIEEFNDIVEQHEAEYAELQDILQRLKEAEEDGDGDLGAIWAIMRDGNHRTQAAIFSGEPYIYVEPLEYDDNYDDKPYSDQLM